MAHCGRSSTVLVSQKMIDVKVPELGESIQEVQVSSWLKKIGDWVEQDDDLVELESEKASQVFPAPESGSISEIKVAEGGFAQVGEILCVIDPNGERNGNGQATTGNAVASVGGRTATAVIMPAAERVLNEYKIDADAIKPTGPGGRLTKEDVLNFVEARGLQPGGAAPAASPAPVPKPTAKIEDFDAAMNELGMSREEQSKPMSMIRRTIARRLVEAQQTAALLTTFNEIDMLPVMQLRTKYKERFLEKHGVKLGFMSFFAKATVEGLKRFPAINSEIRGNDVISRNYHDIGIAIGGGKGLVVPVLRNVEKVSFADIERNIGKLAKLAQENKITPSDLEGGTFTISNGGVYGSLLSTPIVNPPQSGILGLHSIQERPVAVEGQVVIRPMMYVALSYDHRIVDGREAVGFLKTIKEVLEEPARLFLEV